MLAEGGRVGNWVIERLLGEGGMGAVYFCHHVLIPTDRAAVKVLKPGAFPGGRERFVRELRVLKSLTHPGIVRLLEGGADGEILYMAMEFLEGTELARRLRAGPMPVAEAVAHFRDLGAALAYAHEKGVFHRDLKPENVFLGPSGPKLLDFGIAIQEGGTRYTEMTSVVGTPAYMPPEVFVAEEWPNPRLADVYALGQLFYEVLTGTEAYAIPEGLSPSQAHFGMMGRKASADPLDPGDRFPAAIRAFVQRATHPEPGQRMADLGPFLALDPAHPDRWIVEPPPGTPAPRSRALLGVAAVGTGAVVLGGALLGSMLVLAGVGWVWTRPAVAEAPPVPAPAVAAPVPVAAPIPVVPAVRAEAPVDPPVPAPEAPPAVRPEPREAPRPKPAPKPVKASVSLQGAPSAVLQNASGKYPVPGPVPAGVYRVMVDVDGVPQKLCQVDVAAGESVAIKVDVGLFSCKRVGDPPKE